MGARLYKLMASALGVLIGPACDGINAGAPEYGVAMPEYGMPTSQYVVSGTVVSSDDGQPIEGIQVRLEGGGDSQLSAGDGTFEIDTQSYCGSECDVTATDVDGDANGAFVETTVPTQVTRAQDGSGIYEAHDVTIEMDPAAGGSGGAGGSGAAGAGGTGVGGGGAAAGGAGGAGGPG